MKKQLFFFKVKFMGYVFDFNDALAYEQWLKKPQNQFFAELGNRLMLDMLQPMRGETLLDIGCGAGAGLLPLIDLGIQVTGIDPSPYMLDIASNKLGHRVDLHRGYAEELPFDDNSFNYACINTTLEFVEDPKKALKEVCRVTKDRIFIGMLNRYAVKGIQMRLKCLFVESVFKHAHFFSIGELKKIIRSFLGDVPISCRSVGHLPATGKIAHCIERFYLVQKCPFGAYVGMMVVLVPRFRTRPLPLTYKAKHTSGAMVG
ncbi:MAG: class I SAM-dependent methyltransferase [Desulfobacterales bacterium]|nr:class I SAM-dependent methyltransferase [Desulfobacterales bacterium]